MGRVDGKVALVTGAARGIGRSHAVRLAEEGADIIAIDLCEDIATVPYELGTEAELAETAKQVEAAGRQVHTAVADIRDLAGLTEAVAGGVEAIGKGLDVVAANAGITSYAPSWELTEEQWQDMIDVNLTGQWKTIKATVPTLLEQGRGGSIIFTSSIGGLVGMLNIAHYVAAKHGVTGLVRNMSAELAQTGIRVNSVNPTTVNTKIVHNDAAFALVTGGAEGATQADAEAALQGMSAMPTPWVEPIDVSHAVVYLASDEARFVTGTTMVIDAGARASFKIPHGMEPPA